MRLIEIVSVFCTGKPSTTSTVLMGVSYWKNPIGKGKNPKAAHSETLNKKLFNLQLTLWTLQQGSETFFCFLANQIRSVTVKNNWTLENWVNNVVDGRVSDFGHYVVKHCSRSGNKLLKIYALMFFI